MRPCAKFGCDERAVATVGVRYAERLVLVGPLVPEADPNLIDLCHGHVERLTPPRGWEMAEVRAPDPDRAPVAEPLTA